MEIKSIFVHHQELGISTIQDPYDKQSSVVYAIQILERSHSGWETEYPHLNVALPLGGIDGEKFMWYGRRRTQNYMFFS